MQNNMRIGVPNEDGQISMLFTKGGSRPGAGRKGFGDTKKISLTLPEAIWETLEQHCHANEFSRSEAIRHIIESYFALDSETKGGIPNAD
ncbi:CopG family transcriptional regulator [Paenibacillus sp. chi10]|uniref:CopG family transcriptional regulator n=1 Tax=Paenibacillus suaedae TaxID=3077233 RepID=A0AAJ2NAE1_9BACL|nr:MULTISPECIES: CopG family transcriptional regulator [unclassified Paenibacillus]MDT8978569.1 CopG family transcriptional regulator [Paenibacillus sp. chi10]GAV12670.1 hypothetical protein PBN151_2603 [Paenibacillus sp. NAIST15-1]